MQMSGTTTAVVDHIIYNAYGKVTSESNPTDGCLFGFTGLPFDKSSGFNMSQTRPYDPATGRWDGPDRDRFTAGDTNLYRYCGNSPTNATDPSGLDGITGPGAWSGEGGRSVTYTPSRALFVAYFPQSSEFPIAAKALPLACVREMS